MLVSVLIAVVTSAFVLYCLFNGSRIKQETQSVRTMYWPLSGIALSVFLTMFNGLEMINLIACGVIILMSMIYAAIPSGFNEKGISLRGMFFEYRKIENIKTEYIRGFYRLNFMVKNMQFYLQVKDDDDKILKSCEYYYKKERNK